MRILDQYQTALFAPYRSAKNDYERGRQRDADEKLRNMRAAIVEIWHGAFADDPRSAVQDEIIKRFIFIHDALTWQRRDLRARHETEMIAITHVLAQVYAWNRQQQGSIPDRTIYEQIKTLLNRRLWQLHNAPIGSENMAELRSISLALGIEVWFEHADLNDYTGWHLGPVSQQAAATGVPDRKPVRKENTTAKDRQRAQQAVHSDMFAFT